jgi:signal transduction histidine kinase
VAPALAGRPEVRDWTYVARDGERMTVRLAVTRRAEADGTTSGYVVVATDVTSEREAARLQDEFVSLVSHELRTPLTSVLGYLELLTDGTDPLSDEQREYLTVIERNARRQLRLVGDLLLTAQVDAGRFSIAPQRVDAAEIVAAAAASAAPAAEAAGIGLVPDVTSAELHADPVRLAQAVDNLVSNAIKFTPSGGTVRLGVRPGARGGAVLVVADSGIGIPPDELSHLTNRFFRASTATRRAIPGVGLGLSITKAIIDAHGGTLEITSTLGEGTTFTVTLPASPPG